MPFTGPMEDRALIRELFDRYADAACRLARDEWLACWTEDASWWTHYFDVSGKAAIAATYDGLMANAGTTAFFGQIGSIEVDGDSAVCRSYAQERIVFKDGSGSHRLVGRYEDTLRNEGGTWLFAARKYLVMIEEMG